MKILCVSDQIDPFVYSNSAKQRFSDIDMILCAGDLPMDYVDFIVSTLNKPTYFIFGNHDLKEYGFYHKVKSSGAHPYTAPTSSLDSMSHNHGAIYAGFKSLALRELPPIDFNGKKSPLLLVGISGSMRYNNGEDQYTDFQMFCNLLKLIPVLFWNKIRYGRYLDIFLTHATPRKIHDKEDPCHKGFKCFNWFIEHFHPKYMIHGHIHLYDAQAPRVTVHKDTTIINAYSKYVFDFEHFNETESRSSI